MSAGPNSDPRPDTHTHPYREVPESELERDNRSLGDLFSDLTHNATALFRQEVELAKVEMKQEAVKAGKAGGLMGAGAVLGHLALLLVTFAAAWGMAEVMPTGLAFLIVAVVVGAIAGVLGMRGKKQFDEVDPTPRTTVQTIQEDKQWLSEMTDR